MNRIIKTDLFNILDLINCAETYGFGDDMFYAAMFDMIKPVGNLEIKEYSETYETPEMEELGYTREDALRVVEHLMKLRDKYEVRS